MSVGQELVDPRNGVAIGEASERRGQPWVPVDAGQLAVFDERGDHRSVVASLVGAGEQGVLAVEGKRSDNPGLSETDLGWEPARRGIAELAR